MLIRYYLSIQMEKFKKMTIIQILVRMSSVFHELLCRDRMQQSKCIGNMGESQKHSIKGETGKISQLTLKAQIHNTSIQKPFDSLEWASGLNKHVLLCTSTVSLFTFLLPIYVSVKFLLK